MATSFRLPAQQVNQLNRLAKRLGVSKAQVVNQAIDRYFEEQFGKSKRSALDRLLDAGFEPIQTRPGDLASDEAKQREIISAKLRKKGGS